MAGEREHPEERLLVGYGGLDEPLRRSPEHEDLPGMHDTGGEIDERGMDLVGDYRKLFTGLLALVLLVVAIYFFLPKVIGFDDALAKIDDAEWYWMMVAIAFNVGAFAAYVALFKGVLGGTRTDEQLKRRLNARASYQITMAGLAATRIFSAAGAGGLVLTYWALRKAGLERRRAACRMVAFLVLLYTVYLAALVLFGLLLRTGVLPGANPVGGTIVPAAIAAGVLVLLVLVALIPRDMERRIARLQGHPRTARVGSRLAVAPATLATGVRTAGDFIRRPRRGAVAVLGAVGFWAANIGVLWASFEAFGADVAFGVLVQGFFVGMTANLIPSPAGGVGSVDAGMIGAFLLFGVPSGVVFPAVLAYRIIAFWLPVPPGIVAYLQLRRTVAGWERESYTIKSKVTAEAT